MVVGVWMLLKMSRKGVNEVQQHHSCYTGNVASGCLLDFPVHWSCVIDLTLYASISWICTVTTSHCVHHRFLFLVLLQFPFDPFLHCKK